MHTYIRRAIFASDHKHARDIRSRLDTYIDAVDIVGDDGIPSYTGKITSDGDCPLAKPLPSFWS